MAEKFKSKSGEGGLEKGSRWYRNFNAFVGAAALAGSVVLSPGAALALQAYGVFNLGQAGLGEIGRRYAKKRRQKEK
ncbi:MAG: hypothetical protein WD885_01105 [Candidatus Saccharimonadales bacterium]